MLGLFNNITFCFYAFFCSLLTSSLPLSSPFLPFFPPFRNTPWQLLHLCLVREYLDLEFRQIADKLSFEYDLEKIIDDFVFLCFFIGLFCFVYWIVFAWIDCIALFFVLCFLVGCFVCRFVFHRFFVFFVPPKRHYDHREWFFTISSVFNHCKWVIEWYDSTL